MKYFWTVLFLLVISFPVQGQEMLSEYTITRGAGKMFSSNPRYYQKVDGSWDTINHAIYTRETPTGDGYRRGIWRDQDMIELPDSLNATLPIKVSDRNGNYFAFRPVGIVRHVGGSVDVQNVIKFSNTINGISISGNTVTYLLGTGSSLRLIYDGRKIKQELSFSVIDRRKLIQLIPSADYVGIAYEWAKSGNKYNIAFNSGLAWTPDSTTYQVYDMMQDYVGSHYWLAGVTWAAFRDTLNHPGTFIIDPTVAVKGPGAIRETTIWNLTEKNKVADTSIRIGTFNPGIGRGLIAIDFADSIPASAKVIGAKLILYESGKAGAGQSTVSIYALNDSADYGNSYPSWTYKDFDARSTWNTAGLGAGTDYRASELQTLTIKNTGAAYDTFSSAALIDWIQSIIDGDSVNYGLYLKGGSEGATGNEIQFSSSEAASSNQWPVLEIEYEVGVPVYLPLAIVTSSQTDTTFTLDSLYRDPADASESNLFSIYDASFGGFWDTSGTISANEARYTAITWLSTAFKFFDRYNHTLYFRAIDALQTGDSLKISPAYTFSRPGGTGSGVNSGRWDPAIDKIR